MRTYTVDEMKRAFECGRNFQLTAENNFQELIEELNPVNNISSSSLLAADSPPIEDERIFYSVVSDWIGEYGMDTTQLEKSAMEYIRTKIFGKYKLIRR